MIERLLDFLDMAGLWFWSTFVVLILCFGLWLSYREDVIWNRYAAAHHCQKKGTKQGQTAVGWSYGRDGGPVVTMQPDQSVYVCDGGEIVIR